MNLLLALLLLAFGQPPTPHSIPLVDANERTVDGATALRQGTRVIVYVVPGNEPGTRLVDALRACSQRGAAQWRRRIHVVVAASPADARTWLGDRWNERGTRWFADPSGDGWRALGLQGTLGVVGLRAGRVEWKLDGVIADPSVVEPTIEAWVKGGGR